MYSLKKILNKAILKWPEYQAIPEIKIRFVLKQKLRLILMYYGMNLTVTRRQKKRLKRTKILKNAIKSRPVLLVASGPSADNVLNELVMLKNLNSVIDVAVINNYYKSNFAHDIIPKYYFLSDPYFWNKISDKKFEINQLKNYFISYNKIKLVIPFTYEKFLKNQETYYINNLTFYKKRKKLDPTKANLMPSSVVINAITFLKYLGYWPIYVCGLDVSYHRSLTVNHLNETLQNNSKLYFQFESNYLESFYSQINLTKLGEKPESIMQALFDESIMLRDLAYLSGFGIVNVSQDTTNDALPRACLNLKILK